jgi:hypothetical protein
MEGFFRFIASSTGRLVRVVAGLVLIALGVWVVQGVGAWILIIVGLVPLVAGVFDWCVLAPPFGRPFLGRQLRRELHE